MNKIVEIFKAWNIAFNPNDSQSALAAKRIEICNTCENKKESPIIHCGLCGCALKAKIYSPVQNACPAGKWAFVDEDHAMMKFNYEKLKIKEAQNNTENQN